MIATALSTVFGVGYARLAPGTLASAVALPFAWLMLWKLGPLALLAASVVAYLVGIWSTGVYAAASGKHDPSECVIDEVAGQWLACAAAPLSLQQQWSDDMADNTTRDIGDIRKVAI